MKKSCAFFMLFCAISVFAKPENSGPFPLMGGEVPPNGSLVIKLDSLPLMALYDIHCVILDSNQNDPNHFFLTFVMNPFLTQTSVDLNGKTLAIVWTGTAEGYRGELTEGINHLDVYQAYNANSESSFTISNKNASGTALVKACYAEYSTQINNS